MKIDRSKYPDTRSEVIDRYPSWYRKAQNGDVKAAARLFCAECLGGIVADAKRCDVSACFLWNTCFQKERGAPVPKRRKVVLTPEQVEERRARMAQINAARKAAREG